MAKKYVYVRLWGDTIKNFKIKKINMERDLREIGINKKIPLTRIIHATSKVPLDLSQANTSLKRLAKRSAKL